jgi:hypothetical protein
MTTSGSAENIGTMKLLVVGTWLLESAKRGFVPLFAAFLAVEAEFRIHQILDH